MLTLEQTINKRCLLGLSYFNNDGDLLKQSLLPGQVTTFDPEAGITLRLLSLSPGAAGDFIIPANLTCWFESPAGEFKTSHEDFVMINPDYLVTWDIYQSKKDAVEGEQQWWEWVARTTPPRVGSD